MAKQINKLQIEAVVSSIRKSLQEQDKVLIESCRENIKNSEKYKEFQRLRISISDLIKEQDDISNKIIEEKRKIHAICKPDSYFDPYFYNFSYLDKREQDFIQKELNTSGVALKMKSFNSDDVRNELLIQSIDPEFNIQNFIEKYSE